MQLADIELLCCVDCGGNLTCEKCKMEDGSIRNGMVQCIDCRRAYPIIDEVGVFFRREELASYLTPWERSKIVEFGYEECIPAPTNPPSSRLKLQSKAARNWDYQHKNIYHWEDDIGTDRFHSNRFFWTFIPIDPQQVKGKTVYAACVGRGKELYHVIKQGPQKIIANEIGTSLYELPRVIKAHKEHLVCLRYDVSYPPLKDVIADLVICDHALQHVYDYGRAFSLFCKSLKPGGLVSICVYSREHNFLMTNIVEPMKGLLGFLPIRILRYCALVPALFVYAGIHLIYMPLGARGWDKRLPLHKHMQSWSSSTFKFIWSACFDLMHAPISYHFTKYEVSSLAFSNAMVIEKLINTHGTTWSLVARKATGRN